MAKTAQQKRNRLEKLKEKYKYLAADPGYNPNVKPKSALEKIFRRAYGQSARDRTTPYRRAHAKYLASQEWAAKKIEVLAQRGMQCEVCKEFGGRIQVHHLTYERVGHELPADLQVLCRDCHAGVHETIA